MSSSSDRKRQAFSELNNPTQITDNKSTSKNKPTMSNSERCSVSDVKSEAMTVLHDEDVCTSSKTHGQVCNNESKDSER